MLGKRKKKVLLQAILSFLFILLVFVGAWYFAVTYKPPTTQDYIDRSTIDLEDWAAGLGVEAKTRESAYWDFIDEDNTMLPLTGNEFIIGTTDANGIGQYGEVDTDSLEKVNNKFFKPLLEDSKLYFDEKRFIEDQKNSRDKENDPTHTIHRAFQKGKIYCLLRLTPQSDPFGGFFCGIVDEKQIALQKKVKGLFPTVYNPKNFIAFRVTKLENDFALGIAMDNTQGYTWIATRFGETSWQDGEWKIIWKGEEIPLCTDMQSLAVPKSIYIQCYTPESE